MAVSQYVLAVASVLMICCDRGGASQGGAPELGACSLDPDYTRLESSTQGRFTHVQGTLGQMSREGGAVTALALQLVPNDGGRRMFAIRSTTDEPALRLRKVEIHLENGERLEPDSWCERSDSRDAVACFFTEVDMIRLASDCQPIVRVELESGEPVDFEIGRPARALVQGVIEPHPSQ